MNELDIDKAQKHLGHVKSQKQSAWSLSKPRDNMMYNISDLSNLKDRDAKVRYKHEMNRDKMLLSKSKQSLLSSCNNSTKTRDAVIALK